MITTDIRTAISPEQFERVNEFRHGGMFGPLRLKLAGEMFLKTSIPIALACSVLQFLPFFQDRKIELLLVLVSTGIQVIYAVYLVQREFNFKPIDSFWWSFSWRLLIVRVAIVLSFQYLLYQLDSFTEIPIILPFAPYVLLLAIFLLGDYFALNKAISSSSFVSAKYLYYFKAMENCQPGGGPEPKGPISGENFQNHKD